MRRPALSASTCGLASRRAGLHSRKQVSRTRRWCSGCAERLGPDRRCFARREGPAIEPRAALVDGSPAGIELALDNAGLEALGPALDDQQGRATCAVAC